MDLFQLRITGERVYLRLFTADDAPAYLDYLIGNRTFHEPFVPLRDQNYYTLPIALAVTDQRQKVEADTQYNFGIFECITERLVGKITLSGVVRGVFQNAFLSYDVDESVTGRGYATEAVQMLTAYALDALHLHRVQASIMPRNLASQRVVEKAGYIREGYSERYLKINDVWEDHYLYAITAERYKRLPLAMVNRGVVQ